MKDILTFVEQKVRRICSLEAQIENKELRVEITQLIINIGDLESQISILQEINLDLRNTNKKLVEQIEQQNERISKNIIAINDLTAINKSLESELAELVKENDRLNSLKKVNKIVDRKTESDLREKLKHFFEGTLISDDIEDLLNKFDYETFLEEKPEKITSDNIISSYTLFDRMKKGYEYWSKLYLELYNMKVKKEFIY